MHFNEMIKRKKLKPRQSNGFSLVMVMSIGLIGIMGSMAVTSTLFSGKRLSDSTILQGKLLHNAEAGSNYAIRYISQAYNNSEQGSLPETIPLPNVLRNQDNVLLENPTQSYITDGVTANPYAILTTPNLAYTSLIPDVRRITIRAQINGYKRQIMQTILFYPKSLVAGGNSSNSNQSPSNTIFEKALSANDGLTLNRIDMYSSAPPDNDYLVSNSQLTISNPPNGSKHIPGTVTVYNSNPNNIQTLNIPDSTIIDGNLNYQGDTGSYAPKPDVNGDGGVLGDGSAETKNAVINNHYTTPNQNPYLPTQTANQIASTQSTPVYVNTDAGPQLVKVITEISAPQGSLAAAPSFSSSLSSSIQAPVSQINVNGGSYITDTIDIQNANIINFNGPTKIFVQNSTSGAGINLSGNISFSQEGNLQLFYNGFNPVKIDLSNLSSASFKGQIYAPNAEVSINLAGKIFDGAVTSNILKMDGDKNGARNGTFNYVKSFANQSSPTLVTAPAPYKRISWVESNTW